MRFNIKITKDSVTCNSNLLLLQQNGFIFYYYGFSNEQINDIATDYSSDKTKSLLNEVDLDNFLLIALNDTEKTVDVFNDYFGSNEIYYRDTEEGIIISTDTKLLNPTKESIDKNSLYELIIFEAVLPPETVYRDIFCVPSGHVLIASSDNTSLYSYWNIDNLFKKKEYSYDVLEKKGRAALVETLKKVSTNQTAIALSGGIDSGGLLGMYNNECKHNTPEAISIGAYGKNSGDLVSARKSAEHNGANHTEIYPTFESIKQIWDDSADHAQPVCTSIMHIHNLMHDCAQKHSQNGIVYGLGAEMMLGNLRVSKMADKLWFERYLPTIIIKTLYKVASKVFGLSKTRESFLLGVNDWVERFMVARGPYFPWLHEYFVEDSNTFWQHVKTKMSKHFSRDIDLYDAIVKLYMMSWVNYMQYRDMKILGRKYNVQPVIPFDSVRVARALFSTPTVHRKKNNWNKQLIRDIMKPFGAPHLYTNPVKSLVVPYKEYFKGREGMIIEYLRTSAVTGDLFDYDALERNLSVLPESGFFLLHTLGIAVWYDVLYEPHRKKEFEAIFS